MSGAGDSLGPDEAPAVYRELATTEAAADHCLAIAGRLQEAADDLRTAHPAMWDSLATQDYIAKVRWVLGLVEGAEDTVRRAARTALVMEGQLGGLVP